MKWDGLRSFLIYMGGGFLLSLVMGYTSEFFGWGVNVEKMTYWTLLGCFFAWMKERKKKKAENDKRGVTQLPFP